MRQIQSFVERWILKFIVLFNLKYSDFIYLYEFAKIYVKNNIRSSIHGKTHLRSYRGQRLFTFTVLSGSAAFRVYGAIGKSGNGTERVKKNIIVMYILQN